jgi:hypothetical protein
MRAPTPEERESLYWQTDESWYRINEEEDRYELTDKAPKRAVESFELFCRTCTWYSNMLDGN